MFGFFKKRTDAHKLIERIGIEKASIYYAEIVAKKLPNYKVFKQFLLEELDGASQGNAIAQEFARSCPIPEHEYKGALKCSSPEVDGPNGPQQTLHRITLQLSDDRDLMIKFRLLIVGNIARRMRVGTPDTSTNLGSIGLKVDYEEIFSSSAETHRYIYGKRSKTAEILGNDAFIQAWLSSRNVDAVTTIIRNEALNGDIPSIKQMVWVNDFYFKEAEKLPIERYQQLELRAKYLEERIMFCEKAMNFGLKEKSYPAMISCTNLYLILMSHKNVMEGRRRRALNGIVKYAQLFMESGNDDPEMIGDAKGLIKEYGPIAMVSNMLDQ